MKKVMKSADGKYHVKGVVCELLIGSRAQVWHGTAYKTPGGLTKAELRLKINMETLFPKRNLCVPRKKNV